MNKRNQATKRRPSGLIQSQVQKPDNGKNLTHLLAKYSHASQHADLQTNNLLKKIPWIWVFLSWGAREEKRDNKEKVFLTPWHKQLSGNEHSGWYLWQLIIFRISISVFSSFSTINEWFLVSKKKEKYPSLSKCIWLVNSDSECLDSDFGEEKIYFIPEFQ